jgi:PEP-CTERM motif
MKKVPRVLTGAALAVAFMTSGSAQAGTFATINIDTDFSDWAGIPVVDSDPLDNPGFVDFADTQIANDNNFLYIRNTYWGPKSLGTFMGIDIDESTATGFDVFSLGLIGQDAGWQNDFPFTSASGVFNDGNGMSGDFFGSGAGLLDQFADSNSREMAISLDVLLNIDNSPLFPDDTIRILFWTDQSAGDVTNVINYTLAVPEPASMALVGLGALAMLRRRR